MSFKKFIDILFFLWYYINAKDGLKTKLDISFL